MPATTSGAGNATSSTTATRARSSARCKGRWRAETDSGFQQNLAPDLHREIHRQAADADGRPGVPPDVWPEDVDDEIAEAVNDDMVLIEVQTGSYLGEDDIIRYEDVYARK